MLLNSPRASQESAFLFFIFTFNCVYGECGGVCIYVLIRLGAGRFQKYKIHPKLELELQAVAKLPPAQGLWKSSVCSLPLIHLSSPESAFLASTWVTQLDHTLKTTVGEESLENILPVLLPANPSQLVFPIGWT